MCGIAGVYHLDGAPVDRAVLGRMGASIRHRGPDASGVHAEGPVGLVSQRLAIIDLSPAGNQPIANEDGSVLLVFNGEVYNFCELRELLRAKGHVFRSGCDSEVIVHAYEEFGPDCVGHLNGMFAIAVWDRPRRRLWLARDRLGVKPLYYSHSAGRFAFASEIKALRVLDGVGVRANPRAIAQYLEHGYPIDQETWFAGVERLAPGCTVTVEPGSQPRRAAYWDPIDRFREPVNGIDAPARVRELLADSVRIRLRSDVPVGAHLSGGMDSSSLVALMAQQGRDSEIHTFSGAFAEGPEYDERRYVRLVTERYGTRHHEVVPTVDEVPATLPLLVRHMDEPAAGPGLLPQFAVCRLTAEARIKVVIGGQGGDELFGGYPRYLTPYLRSLVRRSPVGCVGPAARMLGRQLTAGRALTALRRRGGHLLRPYHPAFSAGLAGYRPELRAALPDPLANALYTDLRHYLPALLHVEDRTSMAVSIESRTPFLDYRLVELAAGIPGTTKLANGELKHVLRTAVRDLLPPEVAARTDKKGFPTPIGPWFRGPLRGWVTDVLRDPAFTSRRLLRPDYVDLLLSGHAPHVDASTRLWSALNCALWFQQHPVEPTW